MNRNNKGFVFVVPGIFFLLFFIKSVLATENEHDHLERGGDENEVAGYCIEVSEGKILDFFSDSGGNFPLASAVRGGVFPERIPEMSIASFTRSIESSPAMITVRPNFSVDGEIFLMQDLTLERTTNGDGFAGLMSWAELSELYLKDANGSITQYKIPSLREAIEWSAGKTILQLDLFNEFIGVTPDLVESVLSLIDELGAQDRVMMVSWSNDQAKKVYDIDPRLPIAIFSLNEQGIKDSEELGIPAENIVVTTSFDLDPAYVHFVESRDRMLSYITYFLESTDITKREASRMYRRLWKQGVTVQATTRLHDFGKTFDFDRISESSQYLSRGCVERPIGPICDGEVATIVGTQEADVIIGTQEHDVIMGLGGDDIITGLKGDDIICGGTGNDIIYSGPGVDRIFGDEGFDFLYGGIHKDFLDGGADFDNSDGGKGSDECVNSEQVKRCE